MIGIREQGGRKGEQKMLLDARVKATLAPATRELNAFYTLFPLSIERGIAVAQPLLMSGDSAKW